VNQSSYVTLYETECFEYISPSGNHTWSLDGIYYDTIPNVSGCDSLITIHLTIHTVETGVSINGATLTALASSATYQWIDCNGDIPIVGETNQDFTPVVNGFYSCLITQNGCSDTTECYPVFTVDVSGNIENAIAVYPNPADDYFVIDLGQKGIAVVEVRDVNGRLIQEASYSDSRFLNITFDVAPGLYLISVITDEGVAVFKVVRK
jgi:hypothetical protein